MKDYNKKLSQNIALTTLLLVLLGGCSSTLKRDLQALAVKESCCEDYKDLKYETISSNPVKIRFDKRKNVREFSGYKSYYAAYDLQNVSQSEKVLSIKSYINGGWLPSAHIVYPKLLFLDMNFKVLDNEEVKYNWASDFWIGSYLNGQIKLSGKEAYLILYADQMTPEHTVKFVNYSSSVTPIYTGTGTIYVPTGGNKEEFDIPYGPTGTLELTITGKL